MNLRPSGYEPDELPGCSTPRWVAEERAGREYGWCSLAGWSRLRALIAVLVVVWGLLGLAATYSSAA